MATLLENAEFLMWILRHCIVQGWMQSDISLSLSLSLALFLALALVSDLVNNLVKYGCDPIPAVVLTELLGQNEYYSRHACMLVWIVCVN